MRKYLLLVLACTGSLVLPLRAQTGPGSAARRSLPLAEAVALALQQSKEVKRNQAAQQAAGARVQSNRNGLLPTVQANASYLHLSNNVTPFRVLLPGASELALNPQILNQSYNNLQVRQMLWSGGKVRYGIAAAERERAALVAEAGQYRLAAADNVTTSWYTLYTLNASEGIIAQNIKLLGDRRRDLLNLERQGLVLQVEGLKVELAISRLKSSLADIRRGQAIGNFDLALATGLPTDTEFAIGEEALGAPPALLPLSQYLAEATANRPELQALNLRREAAMLGQRIARGNTLPTLSFGGNLDYNRPNLRVFPSQAEFKATSSVFANLSFDLTAVYTNRAAVAESRFAVEQLSATAEQVGQGVQSEVNATYRGYEQALVKIGVAEQALRQATENFRVEQNRLRANTITTTDFLEANTLLLQAQLDLRSTRADAELAYWQLQRSTGRLAQ